MDITALSKSCREAQLEYEVKNLKACLKELIKQNQELQAQVAGMRDAFELVRRKMDSGICPICEIILGSGDQRIEHREGCYVPKLKALLSTPTAGEFVVVRREDLEGVKVLTELVKDKRISAEDGIKLGRLLSAALKGGEECVKALLNPNPIFAEIEGSSVSTGTRVEVLKPWRRRDE